MGPRRGGRAARPSKSRCRRPKLVGCRERDEHGERLVVLVCRPHLRRTLIAGSRPLNSARRRGAPKWLACRSGWRRPTAAQRRQRHRAARSARRGCPLPAASRRRKLRDRRAGASGLHAFHAAVVDGRSGRGIFVPSGGAPIAHLVGTASADLDERGASAGTSSGTTRTAPPQRILAGGGEQLALGVVVVVEAHGLPARIVADGHVAAVPSRTAGAETGRGLLRMRVGTRSAPPVAMRRSGKRSRVALWHARQTSCAASQSNSICGICSMDGIDVWHELFSVATKRSSGTERCARTLLQSRSSSSERTHLAFGRDRRRASVGDEHGGREEARNGARGTSPGTAVGPQLPRDQRGHLEDGAHGDHHADMIREINAGERVSIDR